MFTPIHQPAQCTYSHWTCLMTFNLTQLLFLTDQKQQKTDTHH